MHEHDMHANDMHDRIDNIMYIHKRGWQISLETGFLVIKESGTLEGVGVWGAMWFPHCDWERTRTVSGYLILFSANLESYNFSKNVVEMLEI
jgi:hypothetical protein